MVGGKNWREKRETAMKIRWKFVENDDKLFLMMEERGNLKECRLVAKQLLQIDFFVYFIEYSLLKWKKLTSEEYNTIK